MGVTVLRTAVVFAALVLSMRIMGKRELGQLEPAELVVSVLISNLAAQPLEDTHTPLLNGLLPVATLVLLQLALSAVLLKSPGLRRVLCGRPAMLIRDGKIVQSEMRKNRMTIDELWQELRKKDVFHIDQVQHAVVETDGTISVLLYPDQSPATPRQLDVSVAQEQMPLIVISDGRVRSASLRSLGRDELWLKNELRAREIKSPADVFLLSADRQGVVYFARQEK